MQPPGQRIRVTEAHRLSIGSQGWSILTEWSVLFIKMLPGPRITALLQTSDVSGKSQIFLEGQHVRLLLGMNPTHWEGLLKLVATSGELYYRPFKLGLTGNVSAVQRVFYAYCARQTERPLLISYERTKNYRKGESSVPFLKVKQCSIANPKIIDLYLNEINK